MKKKIAAILAAGALMVGASTAMATALNPYVERQVAIGTTYPGENSLQYELDRCFGANKVDATKDQLDVGMFRISTPGSTGILPQFQFEYTGNSGTQGVGIFGWNGSSAVEAAIFGGSNAVGDKAIVSWSSANAGTIVTMGTGGVTTTAFSGIDKNFFGFYFQPTSGSDPSYYSVDSLNSDGTVHDSAERARVLAFDGHRAGIANSGILFAYEDGTDFDYQDGGIFVESIAPVPEPGTMMLLGAGFLGLAIYGKRRKNA